MFFLEIPCIENVQRCAKLQNRGHLQLISEFLLTANQLVK